MAGFFKRLGRIARSEFTNLGSKLPSFGSSKPPGDDSEAAFDDELKRQTSNETWPAPILQAYAALEIPPGSDQAAVKKAYRSLLRRYHPDKHHTHPAQEATANELTQAIREAYETLSAFLKEGK